jgi:hypothetical protein
MQESEFLNPPEKELAEALQGLQLAPLKIPAHRIWYEAGLRVGRKRARRWCAVAVTTALIAMMLMIRWRQAPATVQRVVYIRQDTAPIEPVSNPSISASIQYFQLCNAAIQDEVNRRPSGYTGADKGYPAPRSRSHGFAGNLVSPAGEFIFNEKE